MGYFRTKVHAHMPVVLNCPDVIIYVDRKVAPNLNNSLGTCRWLSANQDRPDVVAIMRINKY